MDLKSKKMLLNLSFTTSTILDSLKCVKNKFEQISKKETAITYFAIIILTIYANLLMNVRTDFSNFRLNSLQGYVLIFSICYLISLPWISMYIFKKRFSGIIDDLKISINELSSKTE